MFFKRVWTLQGSLDPKCAVRAFPLDTAPLNFAAADRHHSRVRGWCGSSAHVSRHHEPRYGVQFAVTPGSPCSTHLPHTCPPAHACADACPDTSTTLINCLTPVRGSCCRLRRLLLPLRTVLPLATAPSRHQAHCHRDAARRQMGGTWAQPQVRPHVQTPVRQHPGEHPVVCLLLRSWWPHLTTCLSEMCTCCTYMALPCAECHGYRPCSRCLFDLPPPPPSLRERHPCQNHMRCCFRNL